MADVISELPQLFAFDLDGTLLTTDKRISDANLAALNEMVETGAQLALATGRLASSVIPYSKILGKDTGLITLNGAAVYLSCEIGAKPVYEATLPLVYSQFLIEFAASKDLVLNFYSKGKLYCVRNERTEPWIEYYYKQTSTPYNFIDSYDEFASVEPSKIIFVGPPEAMDDYQVEFQQRWGENVYIVKSSTHYLEFLHPEANKGKAIIALGKAMGIEPKRIAAFGDAQNDVPLLREAGLGIAMSNAMVEAKQSANWVLPWTNDEDGVARAWEQIKKSITN